jgi:hypothetical protein
MEERRGKHTRVTCSHVTVSVKKKEKKEKKENENGGRNMKEKIFSPTFRT